MTFDREHWGPAASSVKAAAETEMLWVGGPWFFPGGVNPKYAITWALQTCIKYQILQSAKPSLVGCPYVPYSGVYDAELATNIFYNVMGQ